MTTLRVARVGWSTGLKLMMPGSVEFNLIATSGEVKDKREPVYVNTADVGDSPGRTTSYLPSPEQWWLDPAQFTVGDPNESRVKVITADGNLSREVTVGFDCDNQTLPTLLDWFIANRKTSFTTVVGTTDLRYLSLSGCVWSQLSLSGAANGLVTGSLTLPTTSVQPVNELTWTGSDEFFTSIQNRSSVPVAVYPNDGLVPYWQTGNQDVVSWTMNLAQPVEGKYLNDGLDGPMYFRVGPWEASVTFETLVNPQDPQDAVAARDVRLCAQRLFRPITGLRLEKGTVKGGHNEPARYSFTFMTHGEPTSYTDNAASQTVFQLV
jgi:hypothetical protein